MKYTVNPERLKPWKCPDCGFVCKAGWAFNHEMWCDPQKSIDNFWRKVDKTSHSGGCWLFTGHLDKNGYGDLHYRKTHIQAHRLAWKLTHSEPGELDVLHKCNNPQCCNPGHLYLGTDHDNARDRCTTGKQTRGERVKGGRDHLGAKLKEDQVREIRRLTGKVTQTSLAEKYGVTQSAIGAIQKGRTWKHLP